MRSEWEKVQLGDIIKVQGGFAFKSADFKNYGIPVIKIKNVIPPRISLNDTDFVSSKLALKNKNYLLAYDDILVSMTGSTINQMASAVGKVGKVKYHSPSLLNQRVGRITIIDALKTNLNYIYYYLSRYDTQYQLALRASGSANQANISAKTIYGLEINLPPLPSQRAIADTLSCLDAKIELNNKTNKNLEAQAQAIFKSWFVDFEPFKDGEFVKSELGPIPKGWEVAGLDEIATFLNGLAMQKFPAKENEKGLPVLKIRELRQGFADDSSDICSETIMEEYKVNDGDVVFSWSGSLLVDIWTGGLSGLNQHLFKVTSSKYDKWFYYMWTKHHLDKFVRIAKERRTTMGHIKRSHLSESYVLIPLKDDCKKISELMKSIVERKTQNMIENKTLVALRDLLLPKLMSGELPIPTETH